MILLIDNYDSFVYNLARHFERLGQETRVVRNDKASPSSVRRLAPQAVVLSPGPCTPSEAGCSVAVVRELAGEFPILGVCLGHQAIAAAFGGRVVRAPQPRHGRTSLVTHASLGLFEGVPSPLCVCRYHSLVVDDESLPAELKATAWADDGAMMALEHKSLPVFGVQFHPEAALTEHGYALLSNFLRLAGCAPTADPQLLADGELAAMAAPQFAPPAQPVTF
jgi:anthranilate synthase/aminodeoxychorismate synthase-like glutamine amidotransferase